MYVAILMCESVRIINYINDALHPCIVILVDTARLPFTHPLIFIIRCFFLFILRYFSPLPL